MTVQCPDCRFHYDDALRSTICPHDLLMPIEDLRRKDAAIALLESGVRFKTGPDRTVRRIGSIDFQGYISFWGLEGKFSPDELEQV